MTNAPANIEQLGISPRIRYPKIIPKIITLYLAEAVKERGEYNTVNTENKYASVKKNDEIKIFIKDFASKLNSINKDPNPENKVIKKDVINIISKLFVFVAISFVVTSLIVKNIAANIGKINNILKVKLLGLITIITPIKPKNTAHHL